MAIVAGFDVHRRQITFDALETETGEVSRGRIDATPAAVSAWVRRFEGEVEVAVEACTGWLFVCDALTAAGAEPHLAEPVEPRALRGRKRRAKTDREDARWLRELRCDGRLPEAWIPPEHVRQWRSRARLRHTLIDERTQWFQRIRATLFHHGIGGSPEKLRTAEGRAFLQALDVPADARERIEIALAMIDAIEAQIGPPERELRQLARRQTGCRTDAPVRDGRADGPSHPVRARRRRPALGLAQGGPDGRHRHRRASLRPPRSRRQTQPTGLATAALGAL
jgi:transposase